MIETKATIIVTGGSKGIGLAISQALIEKNYLVISLTKTIRNPIKSPNFTEVEIDLSDSESVVTIPNVLENMSIKRVDGLVNNAGITRDGLIEKMSDLDWNMVLNNNLKSTFLVTKAVLPFLRFSENASVVNISSIIGKVGNVGQSNYAASKGALIALTKSWAKEFNRKESKVRVNSVSPGFIDTQMLESVPVKFIEQVISRTALSRLGDPNEVAKAVCFLLSPEASFINGADIPVDGGLVW